MPETPVAEQTVPPETDTGPSPDEPTPAELAARLAKIEGEHQATVAKLTRERDRYKKASELDPETLASFDTVEERAHQLDEQENSLVIHEYGIDADLLKPYEGKGLEAKREAAQKMQSSNTAQLQALKEQIAKLQGAPVPAKPRGREPAPQGVPVRATTHAEIMDAYIRNPNPETRKAYEAIRGA